MKRNGVELVRFSPTIPIDLSEPVFPDLIRVGRYCFTIKDCKEIDGHDDSLPYSGILCEDGKEIASCTNDGWGGETEIHPIGMEEEEFDGMKKNLAGYKFIMDKMLFDLKIDFIADTLALAYLAKH